MFNLFSMKRQKSWDGKIWQIENNFADFATVSDWLGQREPASVNLHDPLLMHDMRVATERINQALKNKERIMVFGDFDADGVTATAILVDALKRLGAAVSYRIPDRAQDSHGLKDYFIDEIVAAEVTLLITVDCGINDVVSVQKAAAQGLDVIITDHHQPDPERRPTEAVAILNPHQSECDYPDQDLSGAGVAFKLVQALAHQHFSGTEATIFWQKYLDVVTIGLVADCMQLRGEVRALVRLGLAQMRHTAWPGLALLLQQLKIDRENLNEDTIGFYLGPVINAASRLGDVQHAVQLFLGRDQFGARVNHLLQLNDERKRWTQTATEASTAQIDPEATFQLIITEAWPVGLLGLVAGRWSEKLHQPVIVMRREGDRFKASCRAPVWADIETALRAKQSLFEYVGGHPAAAGFSMPADKEAELREHLAEHYAKIVAPERQNAAQALAPALITLELVDLIERHAPYGIGFVAPKWQLSAAKLTEVHWMGAEKNHLRLTFSKDSKTFTAVKFRAQAYRDKITIGQTLDIYFTLRRQVWRGEERLQLLVEDIMNV